MQRAVATPSSEVRSRMDRRLNRNFSSASLENAKYIPSIFSTIRNGQHIFSTTLASRRVVLPTFFETA